MNPKSIYIFLGSGSREINSPSHIHSDPLLLVYSQNFIGKYKQQDYLYFVDGFLCSHFFPALRDSLIKILFSTFQHFQGSNLKDGINEGGFLFCFLEYFNPVSFLPPLFGAGNLKYSVISKSIEITSGLQIKNIFEDLHK